MDGKIYKIKKVILIFTTISCIAILIYSLNLAVFYSQDFQRSGSLALLLGYEPYAEFLNGNVNGIFIKSQAPNYLQTLYFLFIPFAVLPEKFANFLWGLSNISMLLSSTYFLSKIFEIKSFFKIVFILFILLMGFPARNTIGNGQLSIFVMHSILLGIFLDNKSDNSKSKIISFLLFGLSYLKYSFAPAFAAFSFIYFGFRNFLITCLPSILGLIIMLLLFQSSTSIIGPLKVSSITMSYSYGIGDLLSIFKILNSSGYLYINIISSIFCVFLSFVLIWFCRHFDLKRLLPITSLISLMFVNHLGYDYVFYLILLFFSLSKYSSRLEKISIFFSWSIIGYGYWIMRKLDFNMSQIALVSFFFILNFLLFIIIYSTGQNSLKETSDYKVN